MSECIRDCIKCEKSNEYKLLCATLNTMNVLFKVLENQEIIAAKIESIEGNNGLGLNSVEIVDIER